MSSRFGPQAATAGGLLNRPPRNSQSVGDGSHWLPSHALWNIWMPVPRPKISRRLLPQAAAAIDVLFMVASLHQVSVQLMVEFRTRPRPRSPAAETHALFCGFWLCGHFVPWLESACDRPHNPIGLALRQIAAKVRSAPWSPMAIRAINGARVTPELQRSRT